MLPLARIFAPKARRRPRRGGFGQAFRRCGLVEGRLLLAPVIEVGEHVLLPDQADQAIDIYVSGGDLVQGVNLNIQVADGGPEAGGSINGPVIQDLRILEGTIFAGNNTGTLDLDGD